MVSARLAAFATISSLVSSALANFQILSPGGPDLWWVAQSQNVIAWSCRDNPPATVYQLLLNNTDPTILPAPMAIVANIQNADCSHTITTQQAALTPSPSYTLIFADNLDQTKIYATSQVFEVKALGATYPAASATPTDDPTASSTGSNAGSSSTGSSTSSGAAPTNNSKSSGASTTFQISAAGVLAVIGAAVGML
ncbi:hypothetical protein BC834DRAFT_970596 [Gloeopeniophorella convolvens]|nr:hypothetical protein BC834DRAFT_970596 [Gloeopeniophorella convolvens]